MSLVQIGGAEQACSGLNYPSVVLRAEVWRNNDNSGVNAALNQETLHGKLLLARRGTGGTTTHNANGNCAASFSGDTDLDPDLEPIWSSGGISYDFQSANGHGANGYFQMLWEGDFTVVHNTDGTLTFAFAAAWDSPGGDILGDTSVSSSVVLPAIVQTPTAPTSVTATRLSDTQVSVSWAQTNPGNGVPTSNIVQTRVNGGAWSTVATISPATSTTIPASANQKVEVRVAAANAAGTSAYGTAAAPVYTTPAVPTGVSATKDPSLDVVVAFTDNVAFAEHVHRVTPESSSDGGTTWIPDASVDVPAGTTSTTIAAPDPAKLWRYKVAAVNTDTAALASAQVTSNTVQLLAAPLKPTLPALGPNVDRALDFVLTWAHNPVDTTAQTSFEVGYSTDGGSTWSSTGKTTSATSAYTVPGGTYASGVALTMRVRTWGQASTGGSDGTGGSPWSDPATVTFKSAPVATILSPAADAPWAEAHVVVELGFAQGEGATFVRATIVLKQGATVLETVQSTSLASTTLTTTVLDGIEYSITATVLDSNGVTSPAVTRVFDVEYTDPVPATVVVSYLEDLGWAQLDLSFAEADEDHAAAVAFSIARTIDGVTETVQPRRAISDDSVAVIDTLPTIHGTNGYVVTTFSEDGAAVDVAVDLVVTERRKAFLSSGPGYADGVSFSAGLKLGSSPSRTKALVRAAGRARPIVLFADEGSYVVSVSVVLRAGLGSSPQEVERFVLTAGTVCHRDPTGRRVFGALGDDTKIDQPNDRSSGFAYTVTEVS